MAPARPASTVVLLRERQRSVETLLVRRSRALAFAAGLWVFPGGALDREDLEAAGGDETLAARLAAAREAREETGLEPRAEEMVQLSHWTTPEAEPKRFATWFFAAPVAGGAAVTVDGGEILEAQWLSLAAAVARHEAGALPMMPPTYVTLRSLARYRDLDSLLAGERSSPIPEIMPLLVRTGDGTYSLYRGDAGYASGDPSIPGPRHRSVLVNGRWEYLYENVDPAFPRLLGD